MKHGVYRVLVPLSWRGRIYATNERIRLTEPEADEIGERHVELIAEVLQVNGDGSRWTQPTTR